MCKLMKTYVAILRGINVSGQKLIPMKQLQAMLAEFGFKNVTTYIQSGNIVFHFQESSIADLRSLVEQNIHKQFGFEVPVLVFAAEKLRDVVSKNPFLTDSSRSVEFMHVTFLLSAPQVSDFEAVKCKKQDGEEVLLIDDLVYLYCPNGYGRTKLTNNFLEAKLGVEATTRNWKTVNALLNIAETLGVM